MTLLRKAKRPISEYKLQSLPEWHQQRIRADEAKAKAAQVQGNSLKSFSKKRLKRLAGKTLFSTFTAKPATKILTHKFKTKTGRVIRSVRQGLKPSKQGLKAVGVRGRRMAPGDRKQERISHALRCVCGCMDEREPQTGEVSRAHLESRAYEATRNADWNNLPACLAVNHWLDHEVQGERCKAELLTTAKTKGQRLESGEVRPLLDTYGYYTWVATSWRI